MNSFIRRILAGQLAPYLKTLGILLAGAAVLYTQTMLSGCGEQNPISPPLTGSDVSGQVGLGDQPPPVDPGISANSTSASPGQRVQRTLGATENLSGGAGGEDVWLQTGEPVTLTWTPPPQASGFAFDRSPQPGGPPFVWPSVPPATSIDVQFTMPNLPASRTAMLLVETLQASAGGWSSASSYTTRLAAPGAPPDAAPPPTLLNMQPATLADTPMLWSVGRFLDPKGVALTTSLCQDWITRMQSDKAFLAMRLPLSPTTAVTLSQPIPVAFPGVYSNTLKMGSYLSATPAVTVPVQLRPERFTFLANALPQASGEMWVALGLDRAPVTCPAGTSAPANNWGFLLATHLDLTAQPDNCQGCTLPIYYCYEGQQEPLLATAAKLLGAEATSYQGSGITCIGPQPMQLPMPGARWTFGNASSVMITHTQTISVMHFINAQDKMTVTLSYNSAPLDVAWHVYSGTQTQPNVSYPITGPFSVQGLKFFWLLSDPVPPSVPDGPYTLIVTATSVMTPSDLRWKGDMIWLGNWVAPPLGEPAATATSSPSPTRTPMPSPSSTRTSTATITATGTTTRTPTRSATATATVHMTRWLYLPLIVRDH